MKKTDILSVILGVLLLFSGCGSKQQQQLGENAARTEVLTHVFKGESFVLPEGINRNQKVDMVFDNNRMKVLCSERMEGSTRTWIYEGDPDGGNAVKTELVLREKETVLDGMFTEDGFVYLSSQTTEEGGQLKESFAVGKWTSETGCVPLFDNVNKLFTKREKYIEELFVDGDGFYYIRTDKSFLVMNPNGDKVFEHDVGEYIENMCVDTEGDVWYSAYFAGGFGMQKIDREAKGVGEIFRAPEMSNVNNYYHGPGYDFYYSLDNGLYGWNRDMEAGELVLNWANCDINPEGIHQLVIQSPELVLINYRDSNARFDTITSALMKVPDVDLSAIDVVEVAYVSADERFQDYVIRFNRGHSDIRVVTMDYSVYNTPENGNMGGYTRLVNDILLGVIAPDVVADYVNGNSIGTLFRTMVEKELYTDLYSMMDKESVARRDNLVGCVRNTFEVDKKLTALCRRVNLYAFIAPTALTGGKTSWTLGEMVDAAMALPEGEAMMGRLTGENAGKRLVDANTFGQFIHLKKGKCDFDDPEFLKYLNFIATLPSTATAETVHMKSQSYVEPDGMMEDIACFYTDDVVRLGYPRGEKGRIGVEIQGIAYMIPSVSRNPESAWTFIEDVVTPTVSEMKNEHWLGFPVWKSEYPAVAEEFQQVHYFFGYDNSGIQWHEGYEPDRFDEENSRLNGKPGIHVTFDREKFDEFYLWLENVGTPMDERVPEEVADIINEEISSYLGGAKNAEETAKIIQSRVSLWLAEHS